MLSEYHSKNVIKAQQGVAFISGTLLTEDDSADIEVNPSAYSFGELLEHFRVLGRRCPEVGGGKQVLAILFSTSAPYLPDSYGDRVNAEMAVTNEGERVITSICYPMEGWTNDPMKFFGEALGTALESQLVDGEVVKRTEDPNEQGFKIYTPRGAKLETEVHPTTDYFAFINEAVIGMTGATSGVTAKTKPLLDEAIMRGELEPIPFDVQIKLLHENAFVPEWQEIWEQQWSHVYSVELGRLYGCDDWLKETVTALRS